MGNQLAQLNMKSSLQTVTDDLVCLPQRIVNLYFFGAQGAGDRNWVLIDAGLGGTAASIESAAVERFGAGARPSAIILTHGHFDHIGAVQTLAEKWDAPVYAHPMEMPYLTGEADYPPPDPTVGGGAMARLSFMFPRGGIDLGSRVRELPSDGSVPGMWGWRWIHTPGHAPGHISLFRESDRTLVAGDAFITTKQESAIAVLTQKQEVHGPPMYFTIDWEKARRSVEELARLQPEIAATGHGVPMRGNELREQLDALARDFDRLAVPNHGRYVAQPAVADNRGMVVSVPPPVSDPVPKILIGVGIAALAGGVLYALSRRSTSEDSAGTITRQRR